MGYITQTYDFYEAVTVNKNLETGFYKGFEIEQVETVSDNQAIVRTNRGNFFCESFEDNSATIYMRVSAFI